VAYSLFDDLSRRMKRFFRFAPAAIPEPTPRRSVQPAAGE
jgi:hypothetical protein